jgi:murein DD-endopeptidase MepM/ murein hydrolase activator NlpD
MWKLPLPAATRTGPAEHAGLVFAAPGQPVYTPTYSRVVEVGQTNGQGYVLLEAHKRYYMLLYGLQAQAKTGQRLKPGEPLGLAGERTLYRIGLKPHHPLLTRPKPGTAVHPRTYHEELT